MRIKIDPGIWTRVRAVIVFQDIWLKGQTLLGGLMEIQRYPAARGIGVLEHAVDGRVAACSYGLDQIIVNVFGRRHFCDIDQRGDIGGPAAADLLQGVKHRYRVFGGYRSLDRIDDGRDIAGTAVRF